MNKVRNLVRELVEHRYAEYRDNQSKYGDEINLNTTEYETIISIGTSILCTKWDIGFKGGHFAQSIVDNNLINTYRYADILNVKFIRFYVYLLENVKPTNEILNSIIQLKIF